MDKIPNNHLGWLRAPINDGTIIILRSLVVSRISAINSTTNQITFQRSKSTLAMEVPAMAVNRRIFTPPIELASSQLVENVIDVKTDKCSYAKVEWSTSFWSFIYF